ncbi:MAG: leucine-rich repeat domain-containing protein [Ruminococcus sp.]|nr:leucine-rich repeat domain-containing protein [Ruminococcus sp.]
MKKTLAALFALICVAGGANAALVSPNKNTGNTTIVAQAADDLSLLEGIHAGHYSYKYADTSIYTTKFTLLTFKEESPADGKKAETKSSWTDASTGNEYAIYSEVITDLNKTVVDTQYCIGIKKAKNTILDAKMNSAVDLSELDGFIPSDTKLPTTLVSDLKGQGVKYIADSAFANSYLKTVDLTGVEYIGKNAFNKCAYITEIEIPKTVKFVGEGVFSGSGLKKLTVNNDMPVIPKSFCSETALTEVTFAHPEYIREIGVSAFAKTPLSAPIFNQWYGKDVSNYETLYVDDSAY